MEKWERTEGIIPQRELWKGIRGFALWIVITAISYFTVFAPLYDNISRDLLHKYGTTFAMPDEVILYYMVGNPILKFVSATVFACVIKMILNIFIKTSNQKIDGRNSKIIEMNVLEDDAYLGTNHNLLEYQRLQLRLERGKVELAKYEAFYKKRDFALMFFNWSKKHAVILGIVSMFVTHFIAYVAVLVLAIILQIYYQIQGVEPPDILRNAIPNLIPIITVIISTILAIASMSFAENMKKRAKRLQKEDEINGYTESVNRALWDAPDCYRRVKLIKRLICIVRKKKIATVDEAIVIYEHQLAVKRGIALIINVVILFGIVVGINKLMHATDGMFSTPEQIKAGVDRKFSAAESEREAKRAGDKADRDRRNGYASRQKYADNLKANAMKNGSPEAVQYANQAQKNANDFWNNN